MKQIEKISFLNMTCSFLIIDSQRRNDGIRVGRRPAGELEWRIQKDEILYRPTWFIRDRFVCGKPLLWPNISGFHSFEGGFSTFPPSIRRLTVNSPRGEPNKAGPSPYSSCKPYPPTRKPNKLEAGPEAGNGFFSFRYPRQPAMSTEELPVRSFFGFFTLYGRRVLDFGVEDFYGNGMVEPLLSVKLLCDVN
jgi:hypothetical protein